MHPEKLPGVFRKEHYEYTFTETTADYNLFIHSSYTFRSIHYISYVTFDSVKFYRLERDFKGHRLYWTG